MNLTLTAVFETVSPADGGGYTAYCEELPGAITQGETLDEARKNLNDAIKEVIAANRQLARESQSETQVIKEEIHLLAA